MNAPYSVDTKAIANKRPKKTEESMSDQELLPGIPDHLTILKICTKLPLPALNNLMLVSKGWKDVMQNREIFEARKVHKATQTAFIFEVPEEGIQNLRLAIHFPEKKSSRYLPQLPDCTSSRIRNSFTYNSFDGKVYVFISLKKPASPSTSSAAGIIRDTSCTYVNRTYAYVYDLAGHIGWTKCANPTFDFQPDESIVMNGKIVVCEEPDPFAQDSNFSCAIYNPTEDAWASITTANTFHQNRFAEIRLDALASRLSRNFIGRLGNFDDHKWMQASKVGCFCGISPQDLLLYFYAIAPRNRGEGIPVIRIDGRILRRSDDGHELFDSDTNSWTPLYSDNLFDLLIRERENVRSVRYRGVAIIVQEKVVVSLVEVNFSSNQRSLFLSRCDQAAGSDPQKVAIKHRCFSRGLLKCPVQL